MPDRVGLALGKVEAQGRAEARDRVEVRVRVVRVQARAVLAQGKVALVQGRRVVWARVVRMGRLFPGRSGTGAASPEPIRTID